MKTKLTLCCLLALFYGELALGGYYDTYSSWAAFGWGGYYTPGNSDNVPYFAMHPPVYYSYPRPRTYGGSPFPNPPGLPDYQNGTVAWQPQIIKNEYVEAGSADMDQQSQAKLPRRISNPDVENSGSTGASKDAKWVAKRTSKPLVVYPASIVR